LTASGQEDLYFNRDVFAGETVRTPAVGSTVIRFQDKTQIQVGANSSLTIDRFVYDPSSGTGAGAIKFNTGIFRFISGSMKNKGAVLLTTPTAALAIRGTTFVVAVAADGRTTVGVIDGEVDVAPCGNSAVARENAGQAVRVNSSCDVGQVAPATISDYAADENSTSVTVGGSPADHSGGGTRAASGPRSSDGAGSGNGSGGSSGAAAANGSSGGSTGARGTAGSSGGNGNNNGNGPGHGR
jgi:FecR protein